MPIVASNVDPEQILREMAQRKIDKANEQAKTTGKKIVAKSVVGAGITDNIIPLTADFLDLMNTKHSEGLAKLLAPISETYDYNFLTQFLLYVFGKINGYYAHTRKDSIANIVCDEIYKASKGLPGPAQTRMYDFCTELQKDFADISKSTITDEVIRQKITAAFTDVKNTALRDEIIKFTQRSLTTIKQSPTNYLMLKNAVHKTLEDAIDSVKNAFEKGHARLVAVNADPDLQDIFKTYVGKRNTDLGLSFEICIDTFAKVPVVTRDIDKNLHYITQPPLRICFLMFRDNANDLRCFNSYGIYVRPAPHILPKYHMYIRDILMGKPHSHVSSYDPCFGHGNGPTLIKNYLKSVDLAALIDHLNSWFSLYGYRSPYIKAETLMYSSTIGLRSEQKAAKLLAATVVVNTKKNLVDGFSNLAKQEQPANNKTPKTKSKVTSSS
jgi:hypothetical protein